MSAAKTKAQGIIDENAVGRLELLRRTSSTHTDLYCNVAVFSKSYCPYCKATKALLSEMGAKPYVIELDQVGKFKLSEDYCPLSQRLIPLSCPRRRCRNPRRARRDDQPALRPQYLHCQETHRRQLRPAGEKERAAGVTERCRCYLMRSLVDSATLISAQPLMSAFMSHIAEYMV